MNPMQHFINSFRCQKHDHCSDLGASCSVDTLIELYFYSLYYHLEINDSGNQLIKMLNKASDDRLNGGDLCLIKLPVWHWCVETLPQAFSPMGRNDAEILAAFQFLSKHTLFSPGRNVEQTCDDCYSTLQMPLPVTFTALSAVGGFLPAAVAEEFLQAQCDACALTYSSDTVNAALPTVLILELGLVNFRNSIQPAVVIPEKFDMHHISYSLTGAVLVRQEHFYCIAKVGSSFCVLDDLKDSVFKYSCFSGAVLGDRSIFDTTHHTTGDLPGIHVLLYVKTEALKCSRRINYSLFDRMFCGEASPVELTGSVRVQANSSHMNLSGAAHAGCVEQSIPQAIQASPVDQKSPVNQANSRAAQGNPGDQTDPHSRPTTPVDQTGSRTSQPSPAGQTCFTATQASPRSQTSPGSQTDLETQPTQIDQSGRKATQSFTLEVNSSRTALAMADFLCSFAGYQCQIKINELSMSVIKTDKLFISCHDIFVMSGIEKTVKKNGYSCFEVFCKTQGLNESEHFVSSETSPGKRMRLFISVHLISKYLLTRDEDASQILGQKLRALEDLDRTEKADLHDFKETAVKITNGIIHLNNKSVGFKSVIDKVFLSLKDVMSALDLEKVTTKRGYGFIDKPLQAKNIDLGSAFLCHGKQRSYISTEALMALIDSGVLKGLDHFRKELVSLLFKEVSVSASMKKQINTPKRKQFQKHLEVASSPKVSQKPLQARRPLFKASQKRKKKRQGSMLIKNALLDLCKKHFKGDTDLFFQSFSEVFVRSEKKEFSGNISMKALSNMLSLRVDKKSKTGKSLLSDFVHQSAPQVYNLSALESVHYADNFSGVRLTDKYRRRLPGVFPSARSERLAKKQSKNCFSSVLLPRRTASGWKIDVRRLLEVLEMKYFQVQGVKHWKIHGDARVIGKRHSTFISLNILNNEAVTHGVSFQSPEDVYPIHIFYESDSRDNLEVNLGYPSPTNQALKLSKHQFYLGGDEMFLESILDGSSVLSPTSEDGWNIYTKCSKKSKEEKSPQGLRTHLGKQIDRNHPDSIFDIVPTERVVMCILHAITRCTEKLLSLEVLNILSDANKINERGEQGDFFRQSAIGNLEGNISKRGVRQGNFRILFNKNGSPEPISLNKDCALAILHPETDSFPHPLNKVFRQDSFVQVKLSKTVMDSLKLQGRYTEEEFVKLMWGSFWNMVVILRKDAMPDTAGKTVTLQEIHQHHWGYTEADLSKYKQHCELFYQLFCLRHGPAALTPYMVKLIDHAPQLMAELPFPIARFQSEGAEHLNYFDNKFYFQKTTRHGGKDRTDPILASMHHRWSTLYYSVHSYASSNEIDRAETGYKFIEYCTRHISATVIQKIFRGYSVRKKYRDLGWTSYTSADYELKKDLLQMFSDTVSSRGKDKPFQGMSFVLAGSLTLSRGKSITQSSLKKNIEDNGGAVKESVPYRTKSVSCKKYVVISSEKCLKKKIPASLHYAVRRGFSVVNPNYILDSVEKRQLVSLKGYLLEITQLQSKVTKDVPLAKKHFSRAGSLKTILKRKRRNAPKRKCRVQSPKYLNPAIFYVAQKLKAHSKKRTLQEQRYMFAKHLKEWNKLCASKKQEVRLAWRQSSHI